MLMMKPTLILLQLLTLLLLQLHNAESAAENAGSSAESRLLRQLLQNYDPASRPVRDYKRSINVTYGLSLIKADITDQDELQLVLWQRLFWKDEYLQWNPENFEGIKHLRIAQSKVWRPDITLYNQQKRVETKETQVVVDSNGIVTFIPITRTFTQCSDAASKDFPVEERVCRMKFGSWVFSADQINISLTTGHGISTDDYWRSEFWDLKSAKGELKSVQYSCCPEYYQSVDYLIRLKRRIPEEYLTLRSALIVIALITPFTFAVGRKQALRLAMTLSLLLSFTVVAVLAQIRMGRLGDALENYRCSNIALMIICLLLHLLPRYSGDKCSALDRIMNKRRGEKLTEEGEQQGESKRPLNVILDLAFFIISLCFDLAFLLLLLSRVRQE